jgi:hypothetical protein
VVVGNVEELTSDADMVRAGAGVPGESGSLWFSVEGGWKEGELMEVCDFGTRASDTVCMAVERVSRKVVGGGEMSINGFRMSRDMLNLITTAVRRGKHGVSLVNDALNIA